MIWRQAKTIFDREKVLFIKQYQGKKSFFQEKVENNSNKSKELWKVLKFLGMK